MYSWHATVLLYSNKKFFVPNKNGKLSRENRTLEIYKKGYEWLISSDVFAFAFLKGKNVFWRLEFPVFFCFHAKS